MPLALLAALLSGPRLAALDPWTVPGLAVSRCDQGDPEHWRTVTGPVVRSGDCWMVRVARDPATALTTTDLLLFGLHADADVFDGGRLVAMRDTVTPRTTHATYRHVHLPSLTELSQDDEILIVIRSHGTHRPWIRLSRVVITPGGRLRDWMRAFDVRQQDGARLALATMFALLIVVTPILVRRAEAVAAWYVVSLVGAGLYITQFASDVLPFGMSIDTRSAVAHGGLVASAYATLRFSYAMTGHRPPRWAWPVTLLAVGLLLLVTMFPSMPLAYGVHLLWRALMLVSMLGVMVHWWRERRSAARPGGVWFAGAAAALIVLGLHDTLRASAPEHAWTVAYVLHWGILYLVALMFAALLIRLLDALGVAETAGERLATALNERTRELDREYARRRAAEAEAAIARERHRLMRDMHDGIGGQIVALIAQAERRHVDPDRLAEQLRRSLDDLRLVIDSLDSACADLGVALGNLRGRLGPLLEGLPVEVRWRTAQLPDLPPAPPSTVLGVMRIVQEALTNAIRHAAASRIDIGADWDGVELVISIRDDGRGFAPATVKGGRGLASLGHRAREFGGRLRIDTMPGAGTTIVLTLPLGSPDAPGATAS